MRGKRYLVWWCSFVGSAAIFGSALCGCTTQKVAGATKANRVRPPPEAVRLEPGPIMVTCAGPPAVFSFDKAHGRTTYVSDGMANAAVSTLTPPNLHEPGLEYAAGPIGFVLAPFAATYGAFNAHSARLSAEKLSASELELTQAMAELATQQYLRDLVLRSAGERTRRRVFALESAEASGSGALHNGMVLETKVEELRLERRGKSDTSFGLRIKARARLFGLKKPTPFYEQAFEYQSQTALFIDWANAQGFRAAAETGYRELASQIAEAVFSNTTGEPLLLGAGYNKDHPTARTSVFANYLTEDPVPAIQLAAYSETGSAQLGIYSTGTVTHFTLQRPLTRDDAQAEALSDVAWSLDDLQHSRNSVVQAAALGAAIPLSLWKQAAAAFRGVSRSEYQAAELKLSAAAQESLPHQALAWEVAQQLTPRLTQPVALVKHPPLFQNQPEPALLHCLSGGTLVGLAAGETAASYLAGQGVETALQVHVSSAALEGKAGINPSLAVCVEAQATLYRVRDGAELYACPLRYKSEQHKFTEWAADDAQLFRQAVQRCYRQMGKALAEQLVACEALRPIRPAAPRPTLAGN